MFLGATFTAAASADDSLVGGLLEDATVVADEATVMVDEVVGGSEEGESAPDSVETGDGEAEASAAGEEAVPFEMADPVEGEESSDRSTFAATDAVTEVTDGAVDVVERLAEPVAETVELTVDDVPAIVDAVNGAAVAVTEPVADVAADAQAASGEPRADENEREVVPAPSTAPTTTVAAEGGTDASAAGPQTLSQPEAATELTDQTAEVFARRAVEDEPGISTAVRDLAGRIPSVTALVADVAGPVSEEIDLPVERIFDPLVGDVIAPVLREVVTPIVEAVDPVVADVVAIAVEGLAQPVVAGVVGPMVGSVAGLALMAAVGEGLDDYPALRFVHLSASAAQDVPVEPVGARTPAPDQVSVEAATQAADPSSFVQGSVLDVDGFGQEESSMAAVASGAVAPGEIGQGGPGSGSAPVPATAPASAPTGTARAAGPTFGTGYADIVSGLWVPANSSSALAVAASPSTVLEVLLEVAIAPD
ncbi:hypothetical protein [Occultella gossypii]|uniref:Uncharacterized protein n=1 Tax=Occultella gossypii TaxID=2800820 RepID=A0ABS7SES6_9MICO|nr:hypothetical protein [Occultella gossypii]MBZ2198635.1 hypothetical protein [Occultella gossypii]